MRFSAVVALFSAGLASAALLPRQTELPACAQTCIAGSLTETTCDLTDNSCLCADQVFVGSVTRCITSTCTGDDLTGAVAGAQAMCADSGVTLTSSGTGAPTGTTTTTGTATTTGTGTTAAPTTGTSTSTTATAPATTSSAGAGNGALTNGVSAAAGIAAVVLGAIAL
ncbi:hypothetical protein FA13DRAFT_1813187 [Coprinellus micaceus]|uniref:CFEM domain-containing protein n=1 Tax=Coprinellus micaceus TaxID=71717 RepID=A0A4Y7TFY0_COPMI|nr:hypothetical protein FA13DRAFT_1813187 [Coprinellus micaceus]